ncbi:C40 family peptidase [Maribacter sp. 2-571]|uniref:C40 family peptidase n=1 Tax=Maribacter sp. 2-571 TaxID=3417569 RepID=UPI003D32EB09
MKLKLLFLPVIVLLTSCAKKTLGGNDYAYYKQQIEKSKRLENEKKAAKVTPIEPKAQVKKTSYLTPEERQKFAGLLEVEDTAIENEKLYAAINNWLGTPYYWGGTTRNGVDCSSYVQQIYRKVYGKDIPRTSIEQFYMDTKAHFKNQKYLKEGDLVFFRLRHKDKVVSHVGIYLQNGKFTGSNSPRGVEIANLDDAYWQDKYVACARFITKNN